MNRIGLDPRLPVVSSSIEYLRQLSARLTEVLRSVAASISQIADGYIFTSKTVTATYTMIRSDQIVIANNGVNITVNLPSPADSVGKRFTVKKSSNNAFTVTVDSPSGNIDGAATQVISAAYAHLSFVSDGTDYWTV